MKPRHTMPVVVQSPGTHVRVAGFYLGVVKHERCGPWKLWVLLRGPANDVIVPVIARLKTAVMNMPLGVWIQIEFLDMIHVGDNRWAWRTNVVAFPAPHGVRGYLRRRGHRLVLRKRSRERLVLL